MPREFEDIHEEGARRYGVAWLKANDEAAQTCRRYRFNPTTRHNKEVISAVVLAVMKSLYQHHQLPEMDWDDDD